MMLTQTNISISDFIFHLCTSSPSPVLDDLLNHADAISDALMSHPRRPSKSIGWALNLAKSAYVAEVRDLVDIESGYHFNAHKITPNQLESFRIDRMAGGMQVLAPHLWDLLGALLSASSTKKQPHAESTADHSSEDAQDDAMWDQFDDLDIEGLLDVVKGTRMTREEQKERRRHAILIIKVVILSVIMQSSNQKANALGSVVGIFLHACRAPEKVVNAVSRMGLTISMGSVENAISSLSRESANTLKAMGHSLLVAYAYDNFDVDLKPTTPTTEKSATSLKHLTSGLMFPLQHGVTSDHLKCSSFLWEKSTFNLDAINRPPPPTLEDLLMLHPEAPMRSMPTPSPAPLLSRRDRFNAWIFVRDLVNHGPLYFQQFRNKIGEPEEIEMIPLVTTPVIPTRAMDANNSTVAGNIQTIKELLKQGGVGDPNDHDEEQDDTVQDIGDHIIIFHGDLGTGDRILSAQRRRAIEKTPSRRLQQVIFVPGLFHYKMACADAIWRTFIQPTAGRLDDTSLLQIYHQLRPKEMKSITTKPTFRQMHQTIKDVGICMRLDSWRNIVATDNPGVKTLEDFAASQPSFETILLLANRLANKYVASGTLESDRRTTETSKRDQRYENSLLINKYFLLYEETSHSLDHGDIGRVEAGMAAWIIVFKGVRKHKYASHLTRYLWNVHYIYPKELSRAIRYNILVNPTGKKGKFRAVDWCVELNNLYTKVVYGGEGSNYTVDHILKDSPLVQVYRDIKLSMGENLFTTKLSSAHSYPDMTKTYKKVTDYLWKMAAHTFTAGRSCKYVVPDPMYMGLEAIDMKGLGVDTAESGDDDNNGEAEPGLELDDLLAA
ncbi:hypothetical protein EYR40_002226 [Pleurotus pulmonarius]|nr:hypothetical protein EYR36_002282 [Pleurotus pulmonarius]KAF4583735.1 hypothetical protein EYR40_002226 [Pleurotus pulmonarius]